MRHIAFVVAVLLAVSGCRAQESGQTLPTAVQNHSTAITAAAEIQLGLPDIARTPPPIEREHVDIHGLYMTGWTAGSDRFFELVQYMKASGLNGLVIDVQDDDGLISWETEIPLAKEIGANTAKIPDIEARLAFLKEQGIYSIGRIVLYADPLLGSKRPDMAILQGGFVDSRGIRWPDPYNRDVWDYKLAIAKDAARRGFDEIQFDYIRFPEHRIKGYNFQVPTRQRTEAIESFLKFAREKLGHDQIKLAADVFGLTTSVAAGDDMEIGQDYAAIAAIVDYILPMVYPSHYAPGTYGVVDPNGEPGRIVYESMVAAQKRTWGMDRRKHRPWIQDFSLGKPYTGDDIEDQIRGLARAGIYQWILWDPHNRYTRGVNYGVGGGKAGPAGEWQAEYQGREPSEPSRKGIPPAAVEQTENTGGVIFAATFSTMDPLVRLTVAPAAADWVRGRG